MIPVIPCHTSDALRWFLDHGDRSVVVVSFVPIDGSVDQGLREEISAKFPGVGIAISTPAIATKLAGAEVGHDDILVFEGTRVHGLHSTRPTSTEDALRDLVQALYPGHFQARNTRKVEEVLRLLEQVRDSGDTAAAETSADDPYEILGVSPGASPAEIRVAQRERAALYHPDRVEQLGEKLRHLAEAETKRINSAAQQLLGR